MNLDIGGRSQTAGPRNYINMFGDSEVQTTTGTVTDTLNGVPFTAEFRLSAGAVGTNPVIVYRGNTTSNNFIGVKTNENISSVMHSLYGEQVTLSLVSIDNPNVQFDGFTKLTTGNASSAERVEINGTVSATTTSTDLTKAPYNMPKTVVVKSVVRDDGTTQSSLDIGEIGLQFSGKDQEKGFVFQLKGGTTRAFVNQVKGDVEPIIKSHEDWYRAEPLVSQISAKMAAGQNGFAVITTEAYKNRLTKLDDYVAHKTGLGFKMHVVTEKDYDPQGNTTVGHPRGLAIRNWLHHNYQQLNLLYVMFIGNPDTYNGDVPMLRPRNIQSDYPYADCSGATWDLDGDGILGESADWGDGGIDGVADVYVGRMHIYGDDHRYASVRDMDILLQRSIDWDNEEGDLTWRHDVLFANVGNVGPKRFSMIRNGFVDPLGAHSKFIMGHWGDKYPTTGRVGGDAVVAEHNSHNYGILQYHGHGTPTSIVGTIATHHAERLKPEKPAGFGYAGGCTISKPEEPYNITWALVRFASMGYCGATQPISGLTGLGDGRQTWAYSAYLYNGYSNGEAFWERNSYACGQVKKIGSGTLKMNYYGDPSTVTIPHLNGRTMALSPNTLVEINHQYGQPDKAESFTYTIKNNGTGTADYTVTPNESWLTVVPAGFSLAPGESKTLSVSCPSMGSLPVGENRGSFKVTSTNAAIQIREIVANHYLANVISYASCESSKQFDDSTVTTGKFGNGTVIADVSMKNRVGEQNPCRQNFAVSAWVKLDKVADGTLIEKADAWEVNLAAGRFEFRVYQNLFEGADYMVTAGETPFRYPATAASTVAVTAGQWYHVVLSMDVEKHRISGWVDGVQVAQADLPYKELAIGDTGRYSVGFKKGKYTGVIDDVWLLRKNVVQADVDALASGGFATLKAPVMGTKIGTASTTLKWSGTTQAQSYNVYFGNSVEAVEKATTASVEYIGNTTSNSQAVTGSAGNNFWRIDMVTADGVNKGFVWNYKYDDGFTNAAPVFSEITIADWLVGSVDPVYDLKRFVTDADADAVLTFQLVSGPASEWLSLGEDGGIGSAFGPKSSDAGINTFKVKVTDQWGGSDTTTFTINVISE